MFENGSYKSLPEHVALYEALEASMDRENRDEFLAEKDKSRKKHLDDQDPPPPPPPGLDPSKKKRHDSGASGLTQPPTPQSSAWKTSKTRETPSSSSRQHSTSYSEQPIEDVLITDNVNVSDSEDTDAAHLSKLKTIPDWIEPIPDKDRPKTPKPDWSVLPNNLRLERKSSVSLIWKAQHLRVHLFNAVNMRIRNIVIRKCIEDLQLEIGSYQTKLNLTQPDWDASDFLFKEDYTIVSKPRAVIYRERNDQKKMMRQTEVHKFSDGTLTRILEKLDHMVKDFKLYEYNPGMETRI
nr:hypothetical protein [Tanacetum cinerariifolium]